MKTLIDIVGVKSADLKDKLACFYRPHFNRISLNISLSDSVLETKNFRQKC